MKFEVSILIILALRFGIPHVFVFSKSVYLTCLSLIPLFFYGSIYFQKTKSLPLQLCLCNYFAIAWKCSAWPAVLSALYGFRVSQTMCGEGVSETTFPPKPLTASPLRLGIQKKKSTNKKNRRLRVQARKCLKSIKF